MGPKEKLIGQIVEVRADAITKTPRCRQQMEFAISDSRFRGFEAGEKYNETVYIQLERHYGFNKN